MCSSYYFTQMGGTNKIREIRDLLLAVGTQLWK